jgi:DNA-directed RNA polymerase subunit RPC12/RpoP
MVELKPEQSQSNVNVTLGLFDPDLGELAEKEFPCPLCGAGLPIRASKRRKPYFTCNDCGVQIFVRGKAGIARLNEMAQAGVLIAATKESASHGINLLNRLEQLKLQKHELERKHGIVFKDENVGNALRLVDAEIEKVEGELAKIAATTESDE